MMNKTVKYKDTIKNTWKISGPVYFRRKIPVLENLSLAYL